jgi:hypothetical protein
MRRRSSAADFLAVLILTSVFSAAGWFLWTGVTLAIKPSGAQRIGTLAFKVKNAQRKYTDRSNWETISVNAPLYSYDSIKTAAGSTAVLKLDNGAEIYLDENSLILLDYDSQKRNIEFVYGNLHTGGAADSGAASGHGVRSALTVSAKGSKVDIGRGNASISATESGGLGVTVTSGSVELLLNGKKQEIKENEKAAVQAGSKTATIETIPIAIASPVADYRAITFGADATLGFSWKSGKKMDGYLLEASPDASFSGIAASKDGNAPEAELALAPGDWYVRVTGTLAGAEPSISPARRVHVVRESPVESISPRDSAAFSFRNAAPPLRFLWQGSDLASRYLLELSTSQDFAAIAAAKEADAPQASVEGLAEGEYWWRVKAAYAFGYSGYGPPSRPLRFSLKKTAELGAAEPVLPADGQTVYEKAFRESGLRFSWKQDPDAQSSTLAIFRKGETKNATLRLESKLPFLDVASGLEPGEYVWQVQSLAADGIAAPPSAQRSFSIIGVAPSLRLTEPGDGAESDALPDAALRFSWESEVPLSYSLEISKDPAFADATRKVTTARSVELSGLEAGTYRWRVSALDPKGSLVTRSETRTLTLLKPMDAPTILLPKDGESMELVNSAGIDFSWQEIPEASGYSLALVGPDGKPVFSKTDLSAAGYRLADLSAMKPGRYSVELRALRPGRDGQRSSKPDASSFIVTRVAKLSPPELLSPPDGTAINELDFRGSGLSFSWKNDPGLPTARFTLAGDSGFRDIISEETLTAVKTKFKKLEPGSYYWNVAGVDSTGRSYVSATRSFEVKKAPDLAPPEILTPKSGERVDMAKRDVLSLSWKSVQDATGYSVKLVSRKTGALIVSAPDLQATRWDISELSKLDIGDFTFSVQSLALGKDGKTERRGGTASVDFGIILSDAGGVPKILSPDTMYVP